MQGSSCRVKIIGAGSIGNHLANASRSTGCNVTVVDNSHDALKRMRQDIYPTRYGQWDDGIELFHSSEEPVGGFEAIFIGTPPDTHIELAFKALSESPKLVLVEKPFCSYTQLDEAQRLYLTASELNIPIVVGYDHIVSDSVTMLTNMLNQKKIGALKSLHVAFLEHWRGIFAAHPWLDGPKDSYLGFISRGGGALAEHSHGLNLWQHIASVAGYGRIEKVSAKICFHEEPPICYDESSMLLLTTEKGLTGSLSQDVVTYPTKKNIHVVGSDGSADLRFGFDKHNDSLICNTLPNNKMAIEIEKSRPDDFIQELRHIQSILSNGINESPLRIEHALETMLVIAAAVKSNQLSGSEVVIDYSEGYTMNALKY